MQKQNVWKSKVYWLPVLAAVALAYPIFLTTYTVGCDDVRPSHIHDGILHGRPTNYFSNLLIFSDRPVVQPFSNVLGLILLTVAVTCLCAFWQKIAGDKIGAFPFGMFCALFLTYPMTHELTSYNYMILCIGEGLLLIVAALHCLRRWEESRRPQALLPAMVCLAFAVGAYESNAALYITVVIATFWLEWELHTAPAGRVRDQLRRAVPYIAALAGGLVLKWLLANATALALRGRMATGNGANNMGWDLHDLGGCLAGFVEQTVLAYAAFALEYLPVGILWLAILACLLRAVYKAVRQRTVLPVAFFLVFTLSLFLLGLVTGKSMEYRAAAWPIAVYVGFTVLQWLMDAYTAQKFVKWLAFGAAAYLLLIQCREMNYRLYIDELRWQEEKTVLTDIAQRYETEFDTAKPLVFTGRHQLGDVIMDANYLHKDSFTMRMIARFAPGNGMNERQKYCRRLVQMEAYPVISWALESENPNNLEYLFKSCGYDITVGTPEMFAEAGPLRDTMPFWPAQGSMADMGDYILVDLGEEFLGGY